MTRDRSPRRIAPLRTVALESPADIRAFRDGLAKRFRLPRVRIALNLGGLPEDGLRQHERRINRLLAALGYREAVVGALLLLGLTLAFPLSPAGSQSTAALGAWVAQGLLAVLMGGRGGQLLGLWAARGRLRALCLKVARQAEQQGPRRT